MVFHTRASLAKCGDLRWRDFLFPQRFAQTFQSDVHTNDAAIAKEIGDCLGDPENRDVDTVDGMVLDAGSQMGAWKMSEAGGYRNVGRQSFDPMAIHIQGSTAQHSVSDDGRTLTTEREVVPNRGIIYNVWSVALGDPKGPHVVRVYVEGTLVRTFEFETE